MVEYHYSYRPLLENRDPLLKKQCRRCGAEFQTRARRAKYCAVCKPVRVVERNVKSYAKKQKARG